VDVITFQMVKDVIMEYLSAGGIFFGLKGEDCNRLKGTIYFLHEKIVNRFP
jgi:hypothetical protein